MLPKFPVSVIPAVFTKVQSDEVYKETANKAVTLVKSISE
jgi:hypothetical protein